MLNHGPNAIPRQNVTALYRRFMRLSNAIKHNNLYPYQRHYNLAQGFPQLLHDIISISTSPHPTAKDMLPITPKGFYGQQPELFGGSPALQRQIAEHIQIHTRDTFRNSFFLPPPTTAASNVADSTAISNASKIKSTGAGVNIDNSVIYGLPENPTLQPLHLSYVYQIGVRTLYLLERAVGLRPYIAYVERAPKQSSKNIQSNNAYTDLINQYNKLITAKGLNEASQEFLKDKGMASEMILKELQQYDKQQITKVIPITNNPMSLDQLPVEKQAVLYTIHEYLQQIATNEGKLLSPLEKRVILSQLSQEYKSLLTDSFVINDHHAVERRLVHNISKMNLVSSSSLITTFNVLVQRQQLLQLLKDLQILAI